MVLSQIPNLSPNDVIPQYHFKDNNNGNRFVDFMIINKSKNWLLPIELDGYAKMIGTGEEYHRFNDFLERQNIIINTFGLVLRYSNNKMRYQPQEVINEIIQTLNKQTQTKSTQDIQEQHTKQLIADYESKLKQLQNQQSNNSNNEINQVLKDIQKELHTLKQQTHQTIQPVQPQPVVKYQTYDNADDEPTNNNKLIIIGLVVIIIIGLAFSINYFINKKVTEQLPPKPAIQEVTKPETTKPVEVIKEVVVEKVVEVPKSVDRPKEIIPPKVQEQPKPESKPTPKPIETKAEQVQPQVQSTTSTTSTTNNICGIVVQTKSFNGGVFLNLDNPYPNQTMSIKVWKQTNLDHYIGQRICTYGNIEYYKGKPFINVNNLKQLVFNDLFIVIHCYITKLNPLKGV